MNERLENISAVSSALRLADVDFEALYSGRNDITPLAAVEIYLSEQLKIKTEKQNAVRRKRANLPNEKTLEQFDFGFQKSISKELMLRLCDMTWSLNMEPCKWQ